MLYQEKMSLSLSLSFLLVFVHFGCEQTTLEYFEGLFSFSVVGSPQPLIPGSSKASIQLQKVHLILASMLRTVPQLLGHTFPETNHLL